MPNTKEKLSTEFLRYAVSTGVFGMGMSLGVQSPAALMNIHSARIFLTIQDVKEQWTYSGMDLPRALTSAGSVLSSSVILVSGYSRAARVTESAYLAMEAFCKLEQWVNIWKVKRAQSAPSNQLMAIYSKASFSAVISVVELLSFMFSIWPVYFLANVLKGSHFIYTTLYALFKNSSQNSGTGKKKIDMLISACFKQ
ncbi:hypothetical protein NEIRO03_0632 [Nematocida sp. AWRm78]|nr:hypothetical protein NEIRO02_2154 [Nematocida sp. AWRm79]KAI5183005.1 hypothetical protein NEIRO03_0632 [Nematocida sp. AWRm78]